MTIRPADIIVEGQTSGEWVSLGDYTLPKGSKAYVEIAAIPGSAGTVAADALLCVPHAQTF